MDKELEKYTKENFRKIFRREINQPVPINILNEDDKDCNHDRIFYINNSFDGQAFWCDKCTRHERMNYSPGFTIKFPPSALISSPNPKYGAEEFYAFRADKEGVALELPKEEWVQRY